MRVPYLGVLIIRILLFRVLHGGVPYFRKPPQGLNPSVRILPPALQGPIAIGSQKPNKPTHVGALIIRIGFCAPLCVAIIRNRTE